MRLPPVAIDFWELESGEERHERSPDSFWIPPRVERESLRPGQAAKLLFMIEGEHPGGEICVEVERIWVFVTEALDGEYVGILDNQPASLEPSPDVYLSESVEVPFQPEHVVDIDDPPEEYVVVEALTAAETDVASSTKVLASRCALQVTSNYHLDSTPDLRLDDRWIEALGDEHGIREGVDAVRGIRDELRLRFGRQA